MFKVKHFAETVPYTVNGILAKNKDTLKGETIEAVQMSSDEIMAELFHDTGTGQRRKNEKKNRVSKKRNRRKERRKERGRNAKGKITKR